MLKHILVPLDGSHMAEMALPTAVLLSQKLDAAVTLIHVIEHNAPQSVHGDRHLTNQDEAKAYLEKTAQTYFPSGNRVDTHVHTEEVQNVAGSIVGHIGEFDPDLIVMCAHGHSGVRDFMVGNIAQQVIAHSKTPLLLLRPDELGTLPVINRILVALDGISEHETGLPLVARLAAAFSASLLLVQVVPTLGTLSGNQAASGRLLPGTTTIMLEMAESEAEAHLAQHAAEWQAAGLQVQTEVRRGDPAPQVVAAAKNSDLIVIGTHGKAGMQAFWSGSVGPKIITQTHLPILLIPVKVVLSS
jgi:nucleotide-binding universal stress UspA family protein